MALDIHDEQYHYIRRFTFHDPPPTTDRDTYHYLHVRQTNLIRHFDFKSIIQLRQQSEHLSNK